VSKESSVKRFFLWVLHGMQETQMKRAEAELKRIERFMPDSN